MLKLIPLFILAIPALLALGYWTPIWLTRRRAGKPAPELSGLLEGVPQDRPAWLFFHNPACGRCRRVMPAVEKLRACGDCVVGVDVTKFQEPAKRFGVRAIPALLVVDRGLIATVLVGPWLLDTLAKMLAQRSAS